MRTHRLARCTATILGLIATPAFSKPPETGLRIHIRVLDYVNLPVTARAELQTNAQRILGQAGIAADFVECYADGIEAAAEVCRAAFGPLDFNLRILPPRQAMKGEQLGYAAMSPGGGAIVTAFIDPARRKARTTSLSDGALLGHAVAHEIGHLLLGPNAHSSSGIMRPVMRESDEEWMAKGAMIFSAGQARRMRANLSAQVSR